MVSLSFPTVPRASFLGWFLPRNREQHYAEHFPLPDTALMAAVEADGPLAADITLQQPEQHGSGQVPMPPEPVLLSVCVPTYHRPALLRRALLSIGELPSDVEIIVSDNSTADDQSEVVSQRVLARYPQTQWRYHHNPPGGNVISNWNTCLRRARGHYVLMLHDDDFLLPEGLAAMLTTLRRTRDQYAAVLFGVNVVNSNAELMRCQRPRQSYYLPPQEAVEQLLSNSSFVRMAGMVVTRAACFEAGLVQEEQQGSGDTDLWVRICSRYGLFREAACTAAYTVHEDALTTAMFNSTTIQLLQRIFQWTRQHGILPEKRLSSAQGKFFHQFILAGTYRSLLRRDMRAARQVMQLFQDPGIQNLPQPARWLPIKWVFQLLTWR